MQVSTPAPAIVSRGGGRVSLPKPHDGHCVACRCTNFQLIEGKYVCRRCGEKHCQPVYQAKTGIRAEKPVLRFKACGACKRGELDAALKCRKCFWPHDANGKPLVSTPKVQKEVEAEKSDDGPAFEDVPVPEDKKPKRRGRPRKNRDDD